MERLIIPYCVSLKASRIVRFRYNTRAQDVEEEELFSCISTNNPIRIIHTDDGTITADQPGSTSSSCILTNIKYYPLITENKYFDFSAGSTRKAFDIVIRDADEFGSKVEVKFVNSADSGDFGRKIILLMKYWKSQPHSQEEDSGNTLPCICQPSGAIHIIAKLTNNIDEDMKKVKLYVINRIVIKFQKQTKIFNKITEDLKVMAMEELEQLDNADVIDCLKKRMLFLHEEIDTQYEKEKYSQKHYLSDVMDKNISKLFLIISNFTNKLFAQIESQHNIDGRTCKLSDNLEEVLKHVKQIKIENSKKLFHLFVVQSLNQTMRQSEMEATIMQNMMDNVTSNTSRLNIVKELLDTALEKIKEYQLQLREMDMQIQLDYLHLNMKKNSQLLLNGPFRRYWAELFNISKITVINE